MVRGLFSWSVDSFHGPQTLFMVRRLFYMDSCPLTGTYRLLIWHEQFATVHSLAIVKSSLSWGNRTLEYGLLLSIFDPWLCRSLLLTCTISAPSLSRTILEQRTKLGKTRTRNSPSITASYLVTPWVAHSGSLINLFVCVGGDRNPVTLVQWFTLVFAVGLWLEPGRSIRRIGWK